VVEGDVVAAEAVADDPAPVTGQPAVVVIGVGNALRRDDGAGLAVARRLGAGVNAAGAPGGAAIAVLEYEGEPLGLLELWNGARAVVLVDAIRSGAAPGTIHRVDVSRAPVPALLRGSSSTHAVGVGEAIELARELGRLPERVVVYGVEGACFDAGEGLTVEVTEGVDSLANAVMREAEGLAA
jgi:hydrogenase maturation protease